MKRLLISVRNPYEAAIAWSSGVGILDLKEPSLGALGRVTDANVLSINHLRTSLGTSVPLSVAMGEWFERDHPSNMIDDIPVLSGVDYIKWGTSCASHLSHKQKWSKFLTQLEQNLHKLPLIVGVLYADADACQGLQLNELLKLKHLWTSKIVLIDTYNKTGPGLLDLCSVSQLQDIVAELHAHDFRVALAGKIQLHQIDELAAVPADIIGVRSAVCIGTDRQQQIDADRIVQLKAKIDMQCNSELLTHLTSP